MTTPSTVEFKTPSIQPPSVLLMGGVGSGKTYSLATLAEAGLEVFVISTEPVGLDTLIDVFDKKKLMDKLHWAQVTPSRPGFGDLQKSANVIASNTFETLTKMAPSGDRRNAQWIKVLTLLSNFQDERTGKSFGPVDNFTSNQVLVIDSLSGLNIMAMDLVVGDKPVPAMGEWSIAMGTLEKLILSLTSQVKCAFVLISHLEKETNEISGAQQIMASALGRKLSPKLPRFFSEVVMAKKDGATFTWSTVEPGADLKARSLALDSKLPPTFVPVIDAYKRRVKAAVTPTAA